MTTETRSRSDAVEAVAATLLPRASLLTRVLLRSGPRSLSRTEAGLLATLTAGPRRITELAETEALAQPTVTQLVDRLHKRGLVERGRSPQDGRVVLVSLTAAGRDELDAVRAHYRRLMREAVRELSDDELAALVEATETLGRLVEALQRGSGGGR